MIQDEDVQQAFTQAYAKHLAHPERAMPDGVDSPTAYVYRHPGLAAARARDRQAQYRHDRGLDRPRAPQPIVEYRDPPLTAPQIASVLDHYRHFLGQVKYFPLDEMARLRLPIIVWQHIFSSAKKRVETGYNMENPPAYVMKIANKQKHFVRLVP